MSGIYPKRIPALVLTYDRNRIFTEHMILKYNELWPDNPFCFHIPYQNDTLVKATQRYKLIQSKAGVIETLWSLIDAMEPEHWVYWCIDDKYPINLAIEPIKAMTAMVMSEQLEGVDGFLFCRARALLKRKNVRRCQLQYPLGEPAMLERKTYDLIWVHQFLRVKVLKELFSQFPQSIVRPKELDAFKDNAKIPQKHKLLLTKENYAVFGESTSRGKLTANCADSLKASGLADKIDSFEASEEIITIGSLAGKPKRLLRNIFSGH